MERAAGQVRAQGGGATTSEQSRLELLHRCCSCQKGLGAKGAKLMPCFHVLCEPCIRSQIKADMRGNNVNDLVAFCPACERTWRWPDISDYLLAEVVAAVNVVGCQMKGCPERAEEAVAVTRCNECGECLCQGCSDAHRRVTATTNHQLKELPVSRADASRRCRWHPKERIAYLCKCDNFICEICPSRLEHSGPQHDQRHPVHLLMSKSKSDCSQILNQNKHELTNLARSEQMVSKRIEDLKAARESARQQVGVEIVRIHKMVLEQGNKLCRMIDEASVKKQREYEQLRADLCERHSMYQRAQCLAEEIAQCEHPVAVIKSKRQLSDYVNRMSNITNCQAFNGLQLQPHLKFSSVTNGLEDSIKSWGQVLLDYIPVPEQKQHQQQQQQLQQQQQQQLQQQPQLQQQQQQLLQQQQLQQQQRRPPHMSVQLPLHHQPDPIHAMAQIRPAASLQQHLLQQQQQLQFQRQQYSPHMMRPPVHSPTSIQQQQQIMAANGQLAGQLVDQRVHGAHFPVPQQPRPMQSPGASGVVHHGQPQQGTVFRFPAPQGAVRPGTTLADQLQHPGLSAASPTYPSPVGAHSSSTSYPPQSPQAQQRPQMGIGGTVLTAGALLSNQQMRPRLPTVAGMAAHMSALQSSHQRQLTPPPLICARPQMQPQQQASSSHPPVANSSAAIPPPVSAAPSSSNHGLVNSQSLAVRTEIPTTSAPVASSDPPPLATFTAISRSPSVSPVGSSGTPMKKTARKSIRPPSGSRPARTLEDICANLAKSHEDPSTSEQSESTMTKGDDDGKETPPSRTAVETKETSESADAAGQQEESANQQEETSRQQKESAKQQEETSRQHEEAATEQQAVARRKSPSNSPAPAPIRVVLRKSESGYASTSTPPLAPFLSPLDFAITAIRPQERTTPDASLVTTTRVSVQEREDSSWDDYCFVCEQGCDADTGESLGCCAKCPHVFHNSCHIPRIIERMEELPDTWTCTLCQPVVETDSMDNELSPTERLLCEKVLLYCFTKGAKASPFNSPVDKRIISDYKRVIKHPMDFSIIAKRLRPKLPNRLRSVSKFIELMNLVFRNCSIFNPPDSQVAEAGRLVYQDYVAGVKKFMPDKSQLVWSYAMLYKERNSEYSASTDGDVYTDDDDTPGPSKRKRLDFTRDYNANEECD
uniref:E3 ubiquitin-protein ligase TRIM33 n=1 Tax=Plectus sambesii TaxID=2011161 RepID=A0A914VWY9_9BILA